jgi:hypothetical protein
VKAYGCTTMVELDRRIDNDPAQLDYLDLIPPRGSRQVWIDGVAEHQGIALLYLVDGRENASRAPLAEVQKQLANRSDPAWLGVVRPGSLEIYPIGFHPEQGTGKRRTAAEDGELKIGLVTPPVKRIKKDDASAPLFFQSLVHGTFEGEAEGTDYIYQRIYSLLSHTTEQYVETGKLDGLEVLSMTGRALFFRFLIDRKIVQPQERDEICPGADELKDAFSNAEKAALTSAWLDHTFNGDFLTLVDESIPTDDYEGRLAEYRKYYKRIARKAGASFFMELEAILRGWKAAGGGYQPDLDLDWGDLNFAHIPVGVLSQVYESFSHAADPLHSKQTSVHYTPRTIARLMVDECFASAGNAAQAQVLDPSCGAGIFLVLSFRRLVREQWARDGKRPDKDAIHRILYQQLCGFDVSESALRLAALGLYITAIEVNGTPRPPKKLKFPANLRGKVLHHFGDEPGSTASKTSFLIGSLGEAVPAEFNGRFDIVIGNPPWTRLRSEEALNAVGKDKEKKKEEREATDAFNRQFTLIGRRVLEGRGLSDRARDYTNPDNNPDLPFLWRAMEWAKDGGIIALAMHARLFQRTSGKGLEAWEAIRESVAVTGLISGADLRKTGVWEGMDIPWCLVFACNASPERGHTFFFAAPSYDIEPNGKGLFRIDYEAGSPVKDSELQEKPWLLKTLSLGTSLDVEVMEELTRAFPDSLEEVWKKWDSTGEKTGKGYDRSPDLTQKTAPFLGDLRVFATDGKNFEAEHRSLKTYQKLYGVSSAHMPRTEALYRAPLVIVPQSPGEESEKPKAYISDQAIAFSQSFYGYSCKGHPEAEALAALIYLIPHSTLFRYFCLMTSRRTGFDRQTFNKEELDAIPFPDVATLPAKTKKKAIRLAERLQHDAKKPWEEIDTFLFELYGLDADAVQVAQDTLFSSASYRLQGRPALQRTSREDRNAFAAELSEMLAPFFEVCDSQVTVAEPSGWHTDLWREPWAFLAISKGEEKVPVNTALMRKAMEEANRQGASRIIVRAPGKKGVLVGLLNQRRWWTVSRARLCARHIISRHLLGFGLSDDS